MYNGRVACEVSMNLVGWLLSEKLIECHVEELEFFGDLSNWHGYILVNSTTGNSTRSTLSNTVVTTAQTGSLKNLQ